MERVALQSTVLHAASYRDRGALLDLEFRSGEIYRYAGVPAQTYRELLLAESQGRYFNTHIRPRFAYTKIGPASSGVKCESAHKKAPQ